MTRRRATAAAVQRTAKLRMRTPTRPRRRFWRRFWRRVETHKSAAWTAGNPSIRPAPDTYCRNAVLDDALVRPSSATVARTAVRQHRVPFGLENKGTKAASGTDRAKSLAARHDATMFGTIVDRKVGGRARALRSGCTVAGTVTFAAAARLVRQTHYCPYTHFFL